MDLKIKNKQDKVERKLKKLEENIEKDNNFF